MPIKTKLNNDRLASLTANAQVLEEDSLGPKVYRLANGDFLKLFRRKRLISSALLAPYSDRFWRNAARLAELGIPTLTPLKLFRLEDSSLTGVLYSAMLEPELFEIKRDGAETLDAILSAFVKPGVFTPGAAPTALPTDDEA